VFASLGRAIGNFFDGTLRGVVLRSIGLTILLFVVLIAGVEFGLAHLPTLGSPWVNRAIEILTPVLFLIFLFVIGPPVAALFASLFLDRIAGTIEARAYPADAKTPGAPTSTIVGSAVRLALLALVLNAGLLAVDVELIEAPPVAELITILANGWLLGREYFELAALRHMSRTAADNLRKKHGGKIFVGGTMISLLSSVPVVNFVAPLFGAAFMVHLYRRLLEERS
jgi:CysZ protein